MEVQKLGHQPISLSCSPLELFPPLFFPDLKQGGKQSASVPAGGENFGDFREVGQVHFVPPLVFPLFQTRGKQLKDVH